MLAGLYWSLRNPGVVLLRMEPAAHDAYHDFVDGPRDRNKEALQPPLPDFAYSEDNGGVRTLSRLLAQFDNNPIRKGCEVLR